MWACRHNTLPLSPKQAVQNCQLQAETLLKLLSLLENYDTDLASCLKDQYPYISGVNQIIYQTPSYKVQSNGMLVIAPESVLLLMQQIMFKRRLNELACLKKIFSDSEIFSKLCSSKDNSWQGAEEREADKEKTIISGTSFAGSCNSYVSFFCSA